MRESAAVLHHKGDQSFNRASINLRQAARERKNVVLAASKKEFGLGLSRLPTVSGVAKPDPVPLDGALS
jgi:hypothetical protein